MTDVLDVSQLRIPFPFLSLLPLVPSPVYAHTYEQMLVTQAAGCRAEQAQLEVQARDRLRR